MNRTTINTDPEGSPEDVAALVARAQRDPLQFGPLYDRYVRQVYRYILSRVMDAADADDLTAQTFLAALEALPGYRERGCFSAWLFSIARSKLMDHFRRNPPAEPVAESLPGSRGDLLGDLIRAQEVRRVATLIAGLEEGERELIRLRYVAELTFAEMARLLDRKEDATKKAFYRLMERLQRQMEGEHA